MNKTRPGKQEGALTYNAKQLAEILNCGVNTADRIGRESGAKIKVGARALYLVSRVSEYLEEITEQKKCAIESEEQDLHV